jgi:hypothetical protein
VGTTASSVVNIMPGPAAEHADYKVFANPSLFASCYQVYAQSLLADTAPTAASAAPFTSVSVVSESEGTSASTRVHSQAFNITRTGTKGSLITTAVIIFGGRMQVTLDLSSTTVFPAPSQIALVNAVQARVISNLPAPTKKS